MAEYNLYEIKERLLEVYYSAKNNLNYMLIDLYAVDELIKSIQFYINEMEKLSLPRNIGFDNFINQKRSQFSQEDLKQKLPARMRVVLETYFPHSTENGFGNFASFCKDGEEPYLGSQLPIFNSVAKAWGFADSGMDKESVDNFIKNIDKNLIKDYFYEFLEIGNAIAFLDLENLRKVIFTIRRGLRNNFNDWQNIYLCRDLENISNQEVLENQSDLNK